VLPFCLELLRHGGSMMSDPRDSARRRNDTQREVIDALERYGKAHRDERGKIAECLYELSCCDLEIEDEDDELDELSCYIPDHASHALYTLMGIRGEGAVLEWKVQKVGVM
jgi:hypothetical protein